MAKRSSVPALIMTVALALAGCGSSHQLPNNLADPGSGGLVLRGRVTDAAVRGATVTAYHVQAGGVIGEGRDSVESYPVPPPIPVSFSQPSGQVQGDFSLALPDSRPVLLEAKGGSYLDPVSGLTHHLGPEESLLAVVPDPSSGFVEITPWSTMAARLALAKARAGVPVVTAFQDANVSLAKHFSLQDLLDPDGEEDQNDLQLAVGGLAQLAHDLSVEPTSLRNGLARDLSDGTFDGQEKGEPIVVVSTLPAQGQATSTLSPTAATSDLSSSVSAFASNPSATGSPSAGMQSSLQTSDGTVSAAPPAYVSPYSITFTNSTENLTGDFDESPRDSIADESSDPPFDSWYTVGAYPTGQLPWGPIATAYPAPVMPDEVDPLVWQRERVVAVGLKYRGYNYQHHHVPDWNPEPYNWPAWISVMLGHNSAGIDCSDFSSWNYNYGLGLKLSTAVADQAAATSVSGPNGSTVQVQTIAQVGSSDPTDYATLVESLETGDLLYIRGDSSSAPGTGVTHVIMWLGSVGGNSDGVPLVLDSHDNQPVVKDSNGAIIPPGVQIRPFLEGSWYHRAFDHAHRIIN